MNFPHFPILLHFSAPFLVIVINENLINLFISVLYCCVLWWTLWRLCWAGTSMGKYSNFEYVCNSNADCCKGFLEFYNDRGILFVILKQLEKWAFLVRICKHVQQCYADHTLTKWPYSGHAHFKTNNQTGSSPLRASRAFLLGKYSAVG